MAPTLLFAAMLGHIMPSKDLSNRHDSEDDHGDPERGPGTSQDQAFDEDNNDGDEGDQDIEDLYDYEAIGHNVFVFHEWVFPTFASKVARQDQGRSIRISRRPR